jgi:hypothetical protein
MSEVRFAKCVPSLVALGAAAVAMNVHAQSDTSGFDLEVTHRTRYETLDPQYRAGFSNSDQALALQTTLRVDWRRGSFEAVGEIMDSRTLLNDSGSLANTTTTNALEPTQAYVAWHRGDSIWRIGRVTQDLGKRRLVARSRYRNTVQSFAGVDWSWRVEGGRAARAFYWVPLRLLPNELDAVLDNDQELDRGTRDSSLAGLFFEFAPLAGDHRIETYALDYSLDPASDPALAADHWSIGARAYRAPEPGEWNYEIEGVLQRGDAGGVVGGVARPDLDHSAEFLHAELGYAFDRPWSPNLMLQYDRASGDRDPDDLSSERYHTLFGARRFDFGPTGIYGIVARGNIESLGVRLTFRPASRWQGMLSYRSLRLAAARDAWVGAGWRDASGAAGKTLGHHLEGSFTWTAIPDRLAVETGFARLAAGNFPERVAGAAWRGDAQYYYVALITSFEAGGSTR